MSPLRLALSLCTLSALAVAACPAAAQPRVHADHPRIWLNASGRRGISVATLRARCQATAQVWARGCRAGAPPPAAGSETPVRNAEHPLINLALRYLLYGEESTLEVIRQQLSRTPAFGDRQDPLGQLVADAATVRALAVSYDWLYNDLTTTDRANFVGNLRTWGEWLLANTPQDVFASESYVHVSLVGLIGLAFANDPETAADGTRLLRAADDRWKNALLPALATTRDFWPEGPAALTAVAARNALYFAAAWSTATDEDLFATTRARGGDAFNGWARFLAHWLRPDLRFGAFGDATTRQLNPAGSLRPVLDVLAWGTGASVAHAFGDELTRRLPVATDYSGPEAWHLPVFYDPMRPQREGRASLPLAAHLGAGVSDGVVLRSSWDDTQATWISFTCGDWLTGRQHLDVAALQVFRRAPLVVSTGTFDGFETQHWLGWYAQRSVHASTLSVFDPSEMFPSQRLASPVNDGGQRGTDYTNLATRRSADIWRMNLTAGSQYETGSITAFESAQRHDYVACDATRAYSSTRFSAAPNRAKVREVTRQLVYLRPDVLVVFDRLGLTDPRFERRFTLHAPVRPSLGAEGAVTVQNGGGRLIARTLFPPLATREVIAGYRVGDQELAPLTSSDEPVGSRVEVRDSSPSAASAFLHVLHIADASSPPPPAATLIDEPDRLGVRLFDRERGDEVTLRFARSGELGGELEIVSNGGMTRFRGRLGEGGAVFPAVADAGVGVVPDGGAAGDAGVTPPGAPGCGCRAPTRGGGGWSLALLLPLLVRARRRRAQPMR